jgi:hypothetical protein
VSPRARIRLALALLIALTGVVRLVGIDFLLPHWREQDAQLVQHLRFQRTETADHGSGFAHAYPYLFPYLLRMSPGIRPPPAEIDTLEEHLEAVSSFYVETRVLIALLSLLTVPLAFALARRFVGDRSALLAAALAAMSLLTHTFAQQARPHAAAASFFLLAVVAALRLREKPTLARYALGGGAAALALGALHSGVFALLPGLVAHWTREGPRRARDLGKLAAALALVALALPVFYPFFFPALSGEDYVPVESEGGELQFGRHAIPWSHFNFRGARIVLETFAIFEPGLCALLALALVAWLVRGSAVEPAARIGPAAQGERRHGALAVALAFAVPYALVLIAYEDTFDRFAIPLVPYAAVLAAWGVEKLRRRAGGAARIAAALASLALLAQAAGCLKLSWLRARPDTMELATAWVQANASPERDKLFVSPSLELTLARTEESLSREDEKKIAFSRWAKYQTQLLSQRRGRPLPPPRWNVRYLGLARDLGFDSAAAVADEPERFLAALGPGLFVVNASRLWGHASETRVYERLHEGAELLYRAAPHDDGPWRTVGLEFQPMDDASSVYARVMTARAIGPAVEIYGVEAP